MLCNNDNNGDTEADMEINDWNEDDEGELGAEASDTRLECEVHSAEAAPHFATEPPPPPTTTTTTDSLLTASMLQNPNKAGTGGRSKDEINRIILEASKNSAYFKRQGEKAEKLNADICQLKERAAKLTAADLEASAAVVKTLVAARAATRDLSRTIVHVDMDAFYASVEELDRPDLKGKPMAVGGPKAGGTLCTANYEARKWGVRSAMATHIAQKLCPELVILKPNFEKYQKYSNIVRDVFKQYHEKFTPASLDEAYLDLTEYLQQHPETNAEEVVARMRSQIQENSQLTASAGVACNRMIAKVCSDMRKPNGQFIVPSNPESILEFMKDLPIRKIPGIGNVSEQYLKAFGVEKCGDLESHLPLLRLVLNPSLFDRCISISLGIGSVDVNRNDDAIQKGIGREQTAKMKTPEAMIEELEKLAQQLEEDMGESGLAGRCVTLKLKNEDFNLSTRSKTLSHYIWSADDMFNVAQELLCKELEANPNLSLRLIGLRMSTIVKKSDLSQNKSIFVVDPSNEEPDSKKPKSNAPKTCDCPICFAPIEVQMMTTHVISCMEKQDSEAQQQTQKPFPKTQPPKPVALKVPTLSIAKKQATQLLNMPIASTSPSLTPSSSSSSTSSVDDGPKPCPVCGILLTLAIADKHIGLCYVRKHHPDRVDEWKEFSKKQSVGEASQSTNPVSPTKKGALPGKGGKVNHASPRKKNAALSGFGIQKYFIKKDRDECAFAGEKRKRVDDEQDRIAAAEENVEDDENPYVSSQGQKYEGEYGACPVCEKEVPTAFLETHVNGHF